ncbi:hypothetical protein ACFSTC_49655 [Nonomuraea ferruginea]
MYAWLSGPTPRAEQVARGSGLLPPVGQQPDGGRRTKSDDHDHARREERDHRTPPAVMCRDRTFCQVHLRRVVGQIDEHVP